MSRLPRLPRLLGALALAATSLVMAGAAGTPAYACSCAQMAVPAYVDNADAVFTGTVTGRTQPKGRLGDVVYTVAVGDVYKGQVATEAGLWTAGSSAACGIPGLPEDEPLLFFGVSGVDLVRGAGPQGADFAVNLCNGTGTIEPRELSEVEGVTGPPHAPSAAAETGAGADDTSGTSTDDSAAEEADGAGSADDGVSPWLLGSLGIGALVLAVLVGVLLRRRAA